MGFGCWVVENFEIWDLGFGIWDLGFVFWVLSAGLDMVLGTLTFIPLPIILTQ